MEYLPVIIIIVLLTAVFYLLAKQFLVRRDLNAIVKDLQDKLSSDTNTPITTSSSDQSVRSLASELNIELSAIRTQKLRLDNQNTELQNAVTNVAHDLRTPLTAISGYLELLEEEPLEDSALRYCQVIRERTETLKALTEELFQYSVMENASEELKKEKVILNKELEKALVASYQMLSEAGITPEIQMPEEAVVRVLDQKALQRVFGNILSNAAKYSSGSLLVTLAPDGLILFSNPASSLSEIEVGKLFDRFYTVDNAKASMGLGLSIAKLLTEKMGGKIHANYTDGVFEVSVLFENLS